MTYVDYTFYSSQYMGNKIKEQEFEKYEVIAKSIVDVYTFNRIKEPDTNIKMAMCEIIDTIKNLEENEGKQIVSEKVGTYSVSYSASEQSDSIFRKILKRWLAHTGLLYRGVLKNDN